MVWPILISVSVAPRRIFYRRRTKRRQPKVAIAPATAANLKCMVFSLFEKPLFATTSVRA
jgi:hypothetical protein